MAIAGLAGVVPAGDDYVARKLRDLERQITELRSARGLAASTVGAGGIRSSDFDGDLSTADPGTKGWGIGGAGLAVFGNAILRGTGSGIGGGNGAFGVSTNTNYGSGLSVSVSDKDLVSCSLAVPLNFNDAPWAALVLAYGTVQYGSTGFVQAYSGVGPGSGIPTYEWGSGHGTSSQPAHFTVGASSMSVVLSSRMPAPVVTVAGSANVSLSGVSARVQASGLFWRIDS